MVGLASRVRSRFWSDLCLFLPLLLEALAVVVRDDGLQLRDLHRHLPVLLASLVQLGYCSVVYTSQLPPRFLLVPAYLLPQLRILLDQGLPLRGLLGQVHSKSFRFPGLENQLILSSAHTFLEQCDALLSASGLSAGQFFEQFYVLSFEIHEGEVVLLPQLLTLALPTLLYFLQQTVLLSALGQLLADDFVLLLGLSVGSEMRCDVFLLLPANSFDSIVLSLQTLHGCLHILTDLVARLVPLCYLALVDHHFFLEVEVHLLQIPHSGRKLTAFFGHRLAHHLHLQQSLLFALQLTHRVPLRLHCRR